MKSWLALHGENISSESPEALTGFAKVLRTVLTRGGGWGWGWGGASAGKIGGAQQVLIDLPQVPS